MVKQTLKEEAIAKVITTGDPIEALALAAKIGHDKRLMKIAAKSPAVGYAYDREILHGLKGGVKGGRFTPSKTKLYSSHDAWMSWQEFIALEVKDRKNYSMRTVLTWKKKYNLTPETMVKWFTPIKEVVKDYGEDLFVFDRKTIQLIPESDDGNYGYLGIKI